MDIILKCPCVTIHVAAVHIHHPPGAVDIGERFNRLEKILMGMKEDYEAGFAELDAATTAIAERIQAYIDQVNAGGMTAAEEAAGLTRLGALIAPLKAMGTNPTAPVPEPVPDPEPTP